MATRKQSLAQMDGVNRRTSLQANDRRASEYDLILPYESEPRAADPSTVEEVTPVKQPRKPLISKKAKLRCAQGCVNYCALQNRRCALYGGELGRGIGSTMAIVPSWIAAGGVRFAAGSSKGKDGKSAREHTRDFGRVTGSLLGSAAAHATWGVCTISPVVGLAGKIYLDRQPGEERLTTKPMLPSSARKSLQKHNKLDKIQPYIGNKRPE